MKRRRKRKHLETQESQEDDEKAEGMFWAPCLGAQGMLAGGIEEGSGEARRHRSLSADSARSVSRVSVMWDSTESPDAHSRKVASVLFYKLPSWALAFPGPWLLDYGFQDCWGPSSDSEVQIFRHPFLSSYLLIFFVFFSLEKRLGDVMGLTEKLSFTEYFRKEWRVA